MKLRNYMCGVAIVMAGAFGVQDASAGIIRIGEGAFLPGAGHITFSEPGFTVGTINPTYTPGQYGGNAATEPSVNFGGFFLGQSMSATPWADCPGGAASGCVVGTPSGPLSLDPNSPATIIATDSDNPSSPVLSGSPRYNGPVGILFSQGVAGVGLEGGFFNAANSTKIEAFGFDGNSLGYVTNDGEGIEFLGLVMDNKAEDIFGLLFSLVGAEPFGFAIDNLRFGAAEQIVTPPIGVPEPRELGIFGLGLLLIGVFCGLRRRFV